MQQGARGTNRKRADIGFFLAALCRDAWKARAGAWGKALDMGGASQVSVQEIGKDKPPIRSGDRDGPCAPNTTTHHHVCQEAVCFSCRRPS